MPEEFLQFIWENKLFYTNNLKTIDQQKIEIIKTGFRNFDSGPDFFDARIKIDNTIWAGNVEIHKKSSDWFRHYHNKDDSYKNVVLHVVEKYDQPTISSKGESIPIFVFQYPEIFKKNYEQLIKSNSWISCKKNFHKTNQYIFRLGFHSLMVERLQDKTEAIRFILEKNNFDWSETFYQFLLKSFGFKVNAVPFELLAKSLSIKLLAKHKNNIFQLEALLFGNAGFLETNSINDTYYRKLQMEYSFLKKKYKLLSIETHLWKFLRLRPCNFPTVRIAQIASLIYHSKTLFSKIIEIGDLEGIRKLFKIRASEYWDTHYRFGIISEKRKKNIGDLSIDSLIINVIVPFLFVYGNFQNNQELKDRAIQLLEKLPPERNAVIKNWRNIGIQSFSAFDSQALLQLKNIYCDQKKCLNCQIGNNLIKDKSHNNI